MSGPAVDWGFGGVVDAIKAAGDPVRPIHWRGLFSLITAGVPAVFGLVAAGPSPAGRSDAFPRERP